MNDMNIYNGSNFQFSGIEVARLGASEYTLVTIALDMSGSVTGFEATLKDSLKTIIESCSLSPRSDNLLVRLVTFNSNIYEEHGFTPLSNVSSDDYDSMSSASGLTSLYDASISAIESTTSYAKTLSDEEFDANGIVFIITDGDDTSSSKKLSDVALAVSESKRNEYLESIRTVLIGVNTRYSGVSSYLEDFKNSSGVDQYIDINDASTANLAKLANFVSKSISAQSQALGTGGSSQSLSW